MHVSQVNCAEMAGDKQRQLACEIFGTERRFYRSWSQSSTFSKVGARRCQRRAPP